MIAAFTTNIVAGSIQDKPTTQRLAGDFNSFVRLPDGRFLAAGKDGLCLLGGTSNNGVPISAYFEPAELSFGSPSPKRNRRIYLMYKAIADAEMKVSYYPDGDLSKLREVVVTSKRDGTKTVAKALNNRVRGNSWTYRISNVDGADFTCYSLFATISTIAMNHA